MPRHVRFLLLLLVTGASFGAYGQDRYVVDEKCYVPVRTGASLEHRIVFQAPSGTRVSVLESDQASRWSRVRNAEGNDGWLPSRDLKSSPGAGAQLDEALRQLGEDAEGGAGLNACPASGGVASYKHALQRPINRASFSSQTTRE